MNLISQFFSSTKQKVQQRRTEAEQALEQKLFDETQQATKSDDIERRQRKVYIFLKIIKKTLEISSSSWNFVMKINVIVII
jgi:hypothetical protein